jgi:hypothetical protein
LTGPVSCHVVFEKKKEGVEMHKGVILLTKADNESEAVLNAEDFLADFQNHVWDWYYIGGRWSGALTGTIPKGRNPYNENGAPDDVMPLENCLKIVQEWSDSIKETVNWYTSSLTKYEKEGNREMCKAIKLWMAEIEAEVFTNDTNVYNINEGNTQIPQDPKGWFAVMVDMHF